MSKNWRDIDGCDVCWDALIPNNRTAWVVKDRFRPQRDFDGKHLIKYRWNSMKLGAICDAGVDSWERWPGWGAKTTELFKSALRIIAKDPDNAANYIPKDAFDPEID